MSCKNRKLNLREKNLPLRRANEKNKRKPKKPWKVLKWLGLSLNKARKSKASLKKDGIMFVGLCRTISPSFEELVFC